MKMSTLSALSEPFRYSRGGGDSLITDRWQVITYRPLLNCQQQQQQQHALASETLTKRGAANFHIEVGASQRDEERQ